MRGQSIVLRKPVFLLLLAGILALSFLSGFLYKQKNGVQEHNRQLIIQNDSILSVNILLKDSLKQKPLPTATRIIPFGNKAGANHE